MEQPRKIGADRARRELDRIRYRTDAPLPPHREIRSIGELLPDVAGGMERPTQEEVLLLRSSWSDLVGEQVAQCSEPWFIRDFQLHVSVNHPGWMAELERSKPLLLRRLEGSFADLRIRRVNLLLIRR